MKITHITISLLTQLQHVLEKLTDSEYSNTLGVLSGSSIGQHVRHILEFFDCLMASEETGVISYDSRKRDGLLETKVSAAIEKISDIQQFLEITNGKGSLLVEASFLPDQEMPFQLPSSFEREMAFNMEHAVHHMALIKVGMLKDYPHIALPKNFGVAFSTLNYKKESTSTSTSTMDNGKKNEIRE